MKKRTVESDDEEEEEEEEEEEIKDKDFQSSSPPSSHGKDQDFEPTQELRAAVPARVTRGAAKKNPALAASTGEAESEPAPAPGRAKASVVAAAARDEDDGGEDAVAPARSIRRPAVRKPVAVDKELLSLSEDEIEEPDAKPPAKTQATAAADTASKKRSNGQADLSKPCLYLELRAKPGAFS
jgi:hypothetical protein